MPRRSSSRQLSFEPYLAPDQGQPRPGSLNLDLQVRNALSAALKATPLSRAAVAACMTDLIFGDAGEGEITKSQLDAWTAPSRDAWRFPLHYLPAFVQATGATELLDLVAEPAGCKVIRGEEAALLELGAIQAAQRELRAREAELKKAIPAEVYEMLAARAKEGVR